MILIIALKIVLCGIMILKKTLKDDLNLPNKYFELMRDLPCLFISLNLGLNE